MNVPFEVYGDEGRRMLFAHSLTGCGVGIAPLFAPLTDAGWQVAAMDQRGHGTAPRTTDFSLDAMAGDYLGVLDALGWESAWFAGGSMGAAVAQAAAAVAPDRVDGLAVIAPAFGPTENACAARFGEVAAAFDVSMEEGVAAWTSRFGEAPVDQLRPLGAENLACMLRAVPRWTLDVELPAVPVVVVAWEGDDVHPWSLAELLSPAPVKVEPTDPLAMFAALARALPH